MFRKLLDIALRIIDKVIPKKKRKVKILNTEKDILDPDNLKDGELN